MVDYEFGVSLGPISRVDPLKLLEWRNEPSVYRWCRQYEPLELESHMAWYNGLHKRTDVKMYAIRDAKDTSIGVCGLTSIDMINRRAEFSLYIGPEHHGHGHGLKVLKTLCAHGFQALGLYHIFGETFDGNPASEIFEKVGFKKEGTRRGFYFREGKHIDAHLYSILAEEFRKKWRI